jgi:hypothetical protein
LAKNKKWAKSQLFPYNSKNSIRGGRKVGEHFAKMYEKAGFLETSNSLAFSYIFAKFSPTFRPIRIEFFLLYGKSWLFAHFLFLADLNINRALETYLLAFYTIL